jgi:multiple sugar transport system ATP-binding protein
MRVEISQLHSKLDATMIYVTHDQVEAMTMGDRIVVMKDGLVQQVADPITLYDSPANRFVAGFIGTPPMNFFEGRIAGSNGDMAFSAECGISVPVPDRMKDAVGPYSGKDIVLGIRPEDIGSNAAEQTEGSPRLSAMVDVIEPMGSESYVHMSAGDTAFVSRIDAHRKFTVGESADPAVFLDKVHFFDPESETCLT